MSNVAMLTVDDLIDKVIAEAPEQTEKVASVKVERNAIIDIADKLEKLASEIESKKQTVVSEFKADQAEKRAALTQIVKTYLELESSK